MLLDDLLPTFDATRREHRVIDVDPPAAFAAARAADFLDAGRRSLLVRAAFAVRATFERVVSLVRARPRPAAAPVAHLRLTDLEERGEWVRLGQRDGTELAFGAIGRFWGGETVWETIRAEDFAAFDRPGFAKIACSIMVAPHGRHRTLLSYEARTQATDPASRRSFLRYWRVVAPFVGYIMRSMLHVIEDDARGGGTPDGGVDRTTDGEA